MKSEIRNCQNCKNDFTIDGEDFNFYEKIKVPAPTFCLECRTVRRLTWRNEMSLFRRKCDAPGHDEMLISFLPPEENLVVYDSRAWWGDAWDPMSYGKDYDFSKNFFEGADVNESVVQKGSKIFHVCIDKAPIITHRVTCDDNFFLGAKMAFGKSNQITFGLIEGSAGGDLSCQSRSSMCFFTPIVHGFKHVGRLKDHTMKFLKRLEV